MITAEAVKVDEHITVAAPMFNKQLTVEAEKVDEKITAEAEAAAEVEKLIEKKDKIEKAMQEKLVRLAELAEMGDSGADGPPAPLQADGGECQENPTWGPMKIAELKFYLATLTKRRDKVERRELEKYILELEQLAEIHGK